MRTAMIALTYVAMTACAAMSEQRTTTEQEREVIEARLVTIEKMLLTLRAAGKLEEADFNAAMVELGEIRLQVTASAETPVTWATIVNQALNLGLRWLAKPEGEPEAGG